MAKGARKRSNPKKKASCPVRQKSVYDKFPAPTMTQKDADRIKEMFNLSNNVSALIKQLAEGEVMVKQMKLQAKKIEKMTKPVMERISNRHFIASDSKSVAKELKDNAKKYEKRNKLIEGQISHRYEEYLDSLLRLKRKIEIILSKDAETTKTISGHRADEKTKQEEEVIFEKEFDALTQEDKEKLNELVKKAATKNKK